MHCEKNASLVTINILITIDNFIYAFYADESYDKKKTFYHFLRIKKFRESEVLQCPIQFFE